MISYNVLQKRLISQKYKKCSPGKYALLLYGAVSIRWISIRIDIFQEVSSLKRFEQLGYERFAIYQKIRNMHLQNKTQIQFSYTPVFR